MKFTYVLLLLSIATFAQNKVLDVKINTLNSNDINAKKREFTINYQIENLSDQTVTFFLTPNTLIAHTASSMTLFTIYKIYINGEFTPLDGPFFENYGIDWNDFQEKYKNLSREDLIILAEKLIKENEVNESKIVDNYKKNGGKVTDEQWILENQNLLKSKITLAPKEIKLFEIKTDWNKERYYKQDDLEYYLNENDKYEFELTLDLKKSLFKDSLSKEDFATIAKDKNFIQGAFTSNKMIIDFK